MESINDMAKPFEVKKYFNQLVNEINLLIR